MVRDSCDNPLLLACYNSKDSLCTECDDTVYITISRKELYNRTRPPKAHREAVHDIYTEQSMILMNYLILSKIARVMALYAQPSTQYQFASRLPNRCHIQALLSSSMAGVHALYKRQQLADVLHFIVSSSRKVFIPRFPTFTKFGQDKAGRSRS